MSCPLASIRNTVLISLLSIYPEDGVGMAYRPVRTRRLLRGWRTFKISLTPRKALLNETEGH
jgi:hypothetical protein